LPCAIWISICRSLATICSALQFFRLAIRGSFGSGQLSQSTRSKISQSGHPDYREKLQGHSICDFDIRVHKFQTRAFHVIRTDGVAVEFSYRKCI
jgi:hypothetical protein